MSYTKGEWFYRGIADKEFAYEVDCDNLKDESAVACIYGFNKPNDQALANAKLIAAAPDLLEALSALLKAYENAIETNQETNFWCVSARNAISKATN